MGWLDPTTLKFDVEKISKMRKDIEKTASELIELKNTLLNQIEELKNNWQTPAGRKFTEEVDTNWAKQVDQYVKIMNALDELLKVAEENYIEVEEAINQISF